MGIEQDSNQSRRFRNFDWDKAKTFYYVTKFGSFTKAAKFLYMTQPALSKQVSFLESQLGCPLLMRSVNGVKPTRKGKELLSILETTFLELKGFTQSIHAQMNKGKKRKIRISTTHAITTYILNDLILDYNERHPELIFELISEDHLLNIIINDVDIAIRPYDAEAKGVTQDYLFSLEKKLYASPDYLEQYGTPQTVDGLKDHYIIAPANAEEYPYADVNWILTLGLPKGEFHQPVFTSTSIESLIKAAQRGMGIIGSYEVLSILRESNLKNILPSVKENKIDCYFIYPNYSKEDKEIIALKEYLQLNIYSQNRLCH